MQELNKGARRPKGQPQTELRKVGIVGAGFMGASVAYVTANAGIPVVLIDRDMEAAEKGKAHSHKLMSDQIMKGRAKTADRDALLARITPSADYNDLKDCDLVIEAVFEDPKVKAEVIEKVEAAIRPDCIFASNTSTLPISGLAENSKRPGPVHRDPLLLSGREDDAGGNYPRQANGRQGVGDGARLCARHQEDTDRGQRFPRLLRQSLCARLHPRRPPDARRGVPPAMIENAGKQAGMPVGPLSLNDEVGVDLGLKILRATKAQLGDAAIVPEQEALLTRLVEGEGRLGRKNKKGFYDYPEGAPKRLWPGLKDLQTKHLEAERLDMQELKQRLLVTQALEAARTVEEGVITDPREADVGSILGFGFAPYTGGALSYIDFMGAKKFVELCRMLEAKYGDAVRSAEDRPGHGCIGRDILRSGGCQEEGCVGVGGAHGGRSNEEIDEIPSGSDVRIQCLVQSADLRVCLGSQRCRVSRRPRRVLQVDPQHAEPFAGDGSHLDEALHERRGSSHESRHNSL